jgi:flagellin
MPTINTNVAAIKARSNLDRVQREMDTSIARLSSGKRITRAADDAAGMAIAGRMESQIRGLNMSIKSAKDGQSFIDTAEGAIQEISALFQRMRELAVQASSGTVVSADKNFLNMEMQQLVKEVAAIDANTTFNDRTVLTATQMKFFHDIDVNGTAITAPTLAMSVGAAPGFTAATVSIGSTKTQANMSNVVSAIDASLLYVDGKRANLGAISNRFDHIIDNLTNVVANTEAAKSRVEDADFAVETTQLTRNTVLQQAATSMVAQANASKNSILALIQG